ncbi:MAG: mechanosensitive ion channel family protein [Congregibacter sp.]
MNTENTEVTNGAIFSPLREQFKQFLLARLENHLPGMAEELFGSVVILWIVLFGIALHYLLHRFIRGLLVRLASKGEHWQQSLLDNKLFHRLSYVAQGAVAHVQAGQWLEDSSFLRRAIEGACELWILLFGLLSFFALLNALQDIVNRRADSIQFPIRGLIQTIKLIASVLIGLLAVSVMIGKSPLILISGLGALSAILLLVFKDPILGLVAGIQLSANEMLSVGDWLEMPKYGADGDVVDIALTTVKVQNWDKTITTIPTYALISDSFKNWRGMSEAGGRRIKRSLLIDTSSIQFLDRELLQNLKKAELLGAYLEDRLQQIETANQTKQVDMSIRINGRRLSNIGTFRAYLVSFLKAHPDIHQDMTLIVRQLEPTAEGLPMQIYAFTNTTNWLDYEGIQSDIFDHIFAVLPEFGLRAHQTPTGHDLRFLIGSTGASLTHSENRR